MVALVGARDAGCVLLGNAVQNALLGRDVSVPGGLLLAATLIALNWVVGFLTARSSRVERVLEGEPVVLARDGHVFRDVLRRELVSREDFDKALREEGCDDIGRVQLALLKTNGRITLQLREAPKPPLS